MSDSYSCILLHIVFATKFRVPLLRDEIRQELHAYVAALSLELGCRGLEINSVSDHVHILAELSRTQSVAHYLKEIKRKSSNWLKQKGPDYADFYWQIGYGAFSVCPTSREAIRAYILNQQAHHQNTGLETELSDLLQAHEIKVDIEPKYFP